MSVETWKKEFYPKKPNSKSLLVLAKRCLKKWEGTKKQNLKKHKVIPLGHELYFEDENHDKEWFSLNKSSCPFYCLAEEKIEEILQKNEKVNIPELRINFCDYCHIKKAVGRGCDISVNDSFSPWESFFNNHDPLPMIDLINEYIKIFKKSKKTQRNRNEKFSKKRN